MKSMTLLLLRLMVSTLAAARSLTVKRKLFCTSRCSPSRHHSRMPSNLLLENARFAELTYRIAQYFDDTFASGIAAQNAMLTTLSTLLRTRVKTPEAAKAAKDISLRRKPVYQGDLDDIEMYFMAAVKEIKKGIGSHYAEQEAMSKKVAEKMFTELTKGQDVQHPTITAEQLTDAMLDSVSGMEGATPEALEQLRNGLLGILQSAAEQENAHEADE